MKFDNDIKTMDDAIQELQFQEQLCDDMRQELEFMIQKLNEVLFCVEAISPGMSERMRIAIEKDAREEINGTRRRNAHLDRLIDVIMADQHKQVEER